MTLSFLPKILTRNIFYDITIHSYRSRKSMCGLFIKPWQAFVQVLGIYSKKPIIFRHTIIFGQKSIETISRKRGLTCKITWQYYRIELLDIQTGLLRDKVFRQLFFSFSLSLSHHGSLSLFSVCLFCFPDSLSYLSVYIWLKIAVNSESLQIYCSKVHHRIINNFYGPMCCGKDSEAIWSKHRRQILLDGGVDGGVVIGLSVYQHIYIFLIQLFQHIH